MKKDKIIYWTSTSLAMITGALSAFMYFTSPKFIDGYTHLGFPAYFRIELGIAKIIGMAVLLVPGIPVKIKEFAYAGFAITFASGIIAHGTVDGLALAIAPVIPLAFLIVSYLYFNKLNLSQQAL
ncbi:MAG: DoxX family protein [Cyclobacteriaceae bacterium]|nr:DoxX family protein [Cyclobacteriaceae bacterium]